MVHMDNNMASHQPKNVNGFVGEREQARGTAGRYPPAAMLHSQPSRVPTHTLPQQGPQFPPKADLALRRQSNRQAIGDELRVVGLPTIYNPDEMPPKKRSTATLIEEARSYMLKDPGEDIAALASQVASFQPFQPFTIKTPRDTFEDSTSIMTTDTDHMTGDEEYNRYPFATDYNKRDPASNPNLKYVSSDHANQMRGQIIPEEEDEADDGGQQARVRNSSVLSLEPDWREKVKAEKQAQYEYNQSQASTNPSADYNNYAGATQYDQPGDAESNVYDDGYDDIDNPEYQAGQPHDWVNSAVARDHVSIPYVSIPINSVAGQSNRPSQADHFRGARFQTTLTKGYSESAGGAESATGFAHTGTAGNLVGEKKTGSNAMAPPPKPAPTTAELGKQAIRNNVFALPVRFPSPPAASSKTKDTPFGSSSPSPTSEHEMTLPGETGVAAHKYKFEESLDHTPDQLADMSYDELDAEVFLANPNESPRERTHHKNGVKFTLQEELSKMTDMTEDQCKAIFTSMTDAENEGTGQWFIAKMQEDMEKLMIAKHKRRMIALKYEQEIKKRNATVTAKTEDVEGELQGLKSGLGSLMPPIEKDRREAAKSEKKVAKKASL